MRAIRRCGLPIQVPSAINASRIGANGTPRGAHRSANAASSARERAFAHRRRRAPMPTTNAAVRGPRHRRGAHRASARSGHGRFRCGRQSPSCRSRRTRGRHAHPLAEFAQRLMRPAPRDIDAVSPRCAPDQLRRHAAHRAAAASGPPSRRPSDRPCRRRTNLRGRRRAQAPYGGVSPTPSTLGLSLDGQRDVCEPTQGRSVDVPEPGVLRWTSRLAVPNSDRVVLEGRERGHIRPRSEHRGPFRVRCGTLRDGGAPLSALGSGALALRPLAPARPFRYGVPLSSPSSACRPGTLRCPGRACSVAARCPAAAYEPSTFKVGTQPVLFPSTQTPPTRGAQRPGAVGGATLVAPRWIVASGHGAPAPGATVSTPLGTSTVEWTRGYGMSGGPKRVVKGHRRRGRHLGVLLTSPIPAPPQAGFPLLLEDALSNDLRRHFPAGCSGPGAGPSPNTLGRRRLDDDDGIAEPGRPRLMAIPGDSGSTGFWMTAPSSKR